MAPGEPKTANELADERTDLAVKRTEMAASRTMMAWIRTGTSLISFGFTIHKVLQAAVAATASTSKLTFMHPRRLGLTLIFLGIVSIVMGTYEYFTTTRQLNEMSVDGAKVKWNLSLVIGASVALLGLFLFITILVNREVI